MRKRLSLEMREAGSRRLRGRLQLTDEDQNSEMGYLRALPAKMEQEVQDRWTVLSVCSYVWCSQFVQSGKMLKGWALSSLCNKQMGGAF